MNQKIVEKSYLSLIWFFLWSWILLFIPLLVRFLKIYTRKYSYDDKNLYIQEGVLRKNSMTVPLYKVETIRANANILGNGTLHINSGSRGVTSGMNNLEYVKGVTRYQNILAQVVEKAREDRGIKSVDMF